MSWFECPPRQDQSLIPHSSLYIEKHGRRSDSGSLEISFLLPFSGLLGKRAASDNEAGVHQESAGAELGGRPARTGSGG